MAKKPASAHSLTHIALDWPCCTCSLGSILGTTQLHTESQDNEFVSASPWPEQAFHIILVLLSYM